MGSDIVHDSETLLPIIQITFMLLIDIFYAKIVYDSVNFL